MKVTQKQSEAPFWKSNVQKGNVKASIEDVLEKMTVIEAKLDLLLESKGIEYKTDDDAEDDGGWVQNRGDQYGHDANILFDNQHEKAKAET